MSAPDFETPEKSDFKLKEQTTEKTTEQATEEPDRRSDRRNERTSSRADGRAISGAGTTTKRLGRTLQTNR